MATYRKYILDLAETLGLSGVESKIVLFAQTIILNNFSIEESKKMEE